MEQASGSLMTRGVRAFSAHLPLISLLLPSTALRFLVFYYILYTIAVAFRVDTGPVSLTF